MERARTVAWLVMAWLIAGFAGFNVCYAISSGLGILAVLALVLSVAALAASILPVIYGMKAWEEKLRRFGKSGGEEITR